LTVFDEEGRSPHLIRLMEEETTLGVWN